MSKRTAPRAGTGRRPVVANRSLLYPEHTAPTTETPARRWTAPRVPDAAVADVRGPVKESGIDPGPD